MAQDCVHELALPDLVTNRVAILKLRVSANFSPLDVPAFFFVFLHLFTYQIYLQDT